MSGVLGLVIGKVKSYWQLVVAGASALLLLITYMVGRKDGRTAVEAKINREVAEEEKKVADFYKDMGAAELEAEINRPDNRSDLVERLRKSGL